MAEDTAKNSEDRMDTGFRRLEMRLDTLDTALSGVRGEFGELKAHLDEFRDALLADNAKNRDFVAIKVEALRSELRVYADGVIAHGEKLENHETRIKTLETR